jgi:hypothetical protein
VKRTALALALVTCASALAGAARAQAPAEQVARGIRAYRNLDYDSAAVILGAALAQPGSALADSDRVRGLVYLGASELYRERRDSAAAAFGQLLRIDPRYHIDQLIFPPEVTGLFQQVRLITRAVAVVVPPVTELHSAGDALSIWLYATTFHPVDVAVLRPNGVPLRSLYQGGIGDSLELRWDGRASDGNPPDSGRYLLQVDSRGSDGRVARSVALPLDVTRVHPDTLPLPVPVADSLLKPEHSPGGGGLRALATGILAAAAVTLLPSLVAGGSGASNDRYLVAGGLAVAGILGFQVQQRPRPIPANIAANRALQLAWQRRADSVHAQNVTRQQEVRIRIRAGASRVVGAP